MREYFHSENGASGSREGCQHMKVVEAQRLRQLRMLPVPVSTRRRWKSRVVKNVTPVQFLRHLQLRHCLLLETPFLATAKTNDHVVWKTTISFKEDTVDFPANFRDIGYISFEKDALSSKVNELFRELISFGLIKVSVGV